MKVNARYLKGLLRVAARQDIRYYLNGVLFETSKEHGKFYIGTDGKRIAVFHEGWGDEAPEDVKVIIPRDAIEQARLLKLDSPAKPTATLTGDAEGKLWTLNTHEGARLTFIPIDGKFPDWRSVFPKEKVSGEPGDYDWHLLYGFNECMNDVHGISQGVVLYQNGSNAAIIRHGSDDFVGLLMPLKARKEGAQIPHWAARGGTATGIAAR